MTRGTGCNYDGALVWLGTAAARGLARTSPTSPRSGSRGAQVPPAGGWPRSASGIPSRTKRWCGAARTRRAAP